MQLHSTKECVRLAEVFATDYPCHGRKYHDMGEKNDDFIDGDRDGRDIAQLLKDLHQGCKVISYLFCHLEVKTEKMIKEFKLHEGVPIA